MSWKGCWVREETRSCRGGSTTVQEPNASCISLDHDGPDLEDQASCSGLVTSDFAIHVRASDQHFGKWEK